MNQNDESRSLRTLTANKVALVIPAFQWNVVWSWPRSMTMMNMVCACDPSYAAMMAVTTSLPSRIPLHFESLVHVYTNDKRGLITPFQNELFAKGHAATDYPRWWAHSIAMLSKQSPVPLSSAYRVEYTHKYEPYIIIHRSHLVAYDER
jgi:hypothetical protein